MKAALESALEHVHGVWRNRRIAVIVAWAAAVILWLVILAWPDSYQANARVYVDTSTALRPLLQGLTVEQDIEARMNIVREQMLGTDKLERVASEAGFFDAARDDKSRTAILNELRDGILVDMTLPTSARRDRAPTADRIFAISYENPDRGRALQVVGALLKAFVDDTRGGTTAGANDAQRFLEVQLKEYAKRLSESEERLAAFKKSNVGLVPGEEQSDFFSRLQNEITAAKRAETTLGLATRRRTELSRQLRGEQPYAAGGTGMGGAMSGRPVAGGNDTSSRIAESQSKLDELLLRYTDKHPDVVSTRQALMELRARQQQELDAFRRGDAAAIAMSGLASNPVYQSIQVQLNQTDVEIATLRGELADHRRVEADLRRLLNTAPVVEAEFARLTRDYDVNRAQYTSLLERLEKAKLSDSASETGMANFDIVEPPNAATQPVSPKRPLLLLGSLVLALGIGVGVAWLLTQLKPVFTSSAAVTAATGLPVFGVVSAAHTAQSEQAAKIHLVKLGAAAAGLFVAFILVFLLHAPGSRLIQSLLAI
jgi:polysaccharide chain length determinant protein (PEP-CTERM system associated)